MTLKKAIEAAGLTVEAVFVPWSQSRNKDEKETVHSGNREPKTRPRRSLNWRVTLKKDGRDIIATDYSAGVGHCGAYKASMKELGHVNSIMHDEAIAQECETGRAYTPGVFRKGEPIMPNPVDVIYSLALDADVLNYSNFEDWAADCGYDPDSRKGESIYRACLEIALKLRNGLGDETLRALQEAARDY